HLAHHGRGAGLALRVGRADALAQPLTVFPLQIQQRVGAQDLRQRRQPPGLRLGVDRGVAAADQREPARVFFEQPVVLAREGVGQRVLHGRLTVWARAWASAPGWWWARA